MPEGYVVQLPTPAEKDLRRLKGALKERAFEELEKVEANPELGEPLTANLNGVRSHHWSVNKVEYRAAYVVLEEEKVCIVFQVGTRENFYKEAARRLEFVRKQLASGLLPYERGDDDDSEEDESDEGAKHEDVP